MISLTLSLSLNKSNMHLSHFTLRNIDTSETQVAGLNMNIYPLTKAMIRLSFNNADQEISKMTENPTY